MILGFARSAPRSRSANPARAQRAAGGRGMRAEPPDGSPTQTLTDQEWLCGWVRNPDSSFLATPKGPNGVLHLPLTSGKESSPGWLCGVGCATLIHLFWRHRKAGTGCCIPPAQKLVSKSGGWGAYPLFIFFGDTEESGQVLHLPQANRWYAAPPPRTPEGRQLESGWPADVGCRQKDE